MTLPGQVQGTTEALGAEHRTWRFGEFTLDLDRGALLRDGVEVRLRPKSYAVLTYLLERHGRLVTKEEVLDAVWGHTAVTEGALTQVLIDIRRALEDRSQTVIRTVPRRGYVFDVPVETGGPTAPGPAEPGGPQATGVAARRRSVWGSGLAVGVVLALFGLWWGATDRGTGETPPAEAPTAGPRAPSIAVLPFLDLSPEGDQAYFSDGLAEELLNLLAHVPGLKVIARTSSFSFKDQNVDVATIARRLDVDHVLEGSVRKWGNRVRVTAQLVETAGSSHLWSGTYERDFEDVFAIQDEIAAGVADALKVTLADELTTDGGTRVARALEHYLQGRHFFNRRGPGDLKRARERFKAAVEADPGYGRAWAGLAGAIQVALLTRELPWEENVPAWTEAVERALALAPDFPETLARAAGHAHVAGAPDEARAYLDRALASAPDDPFIMGVAAGVAFRDGRLEEAIRLQRRAVAVDPIAATYRYNLASYLAHAGRYDEARASYAEVVPLNPAAAEQINGVLALILVREQRYEEAVAALEALPDGEWRDIGLAVAYQAVGRTAEAKAALARLKAGTDIAAARHLAEVHAQRGAIDEAFRWLETAYARAEADPHPEAHKEVVDDAVASWLLQPLHDDPRWTPWTAKR
jgi:TolB-like protein/DNA-binding winged helix-turn-helix (wHTH) protein/thioredoxin-like negative regulator of GroEL